VQIGGPDECWPWLAARKEKGYGQFAWQGRNVKAHRLAYELAVGPIPPGPGYHGMCVCHTCDNPGCCNPSHLFIGTVQDNLRDMRQKGRGFIPAPTGGGPIGERSGTCKLTDEDVREIRASRGYLRRELAAIYGVSAPHISNILNGNTRRHETPPVKKHIAVGRRIRPAEERFWEKVDVRNPGDCWLWNAGTDRGYGSFYRGPNQSRTSAHRFSYELVYGAIPQSENLRNDFSVLHRCDNPLCVNPAHLLLGTQAENNTDGFNKGRYPQVRARREPH